jgi:D-amino-acid dehydrogenase
MAGQGGRPAALALARRSGPADVGLRFLRECLPGRTRDNIAAIVALALYSRGCLQALRDELGLRIRPARTRHPAHLYDSREFAGGHRGGSGHAPLRLDRDTVRRRALREIEPALAGARHLLVGGDYTPSDESGDAHKFTRCAGRTCARLGVDFRFNLTVDRIAPGGSQIAGVVARGRRQPNC